MACGVEQVERSSSCAVGKSRNGERKGRSRNYHWWLKRWHARKQRHAMRRDPEAPASRYSGYEG